MNPLKKLFPIAILVCLVAAWTPLSAQKNPKNKNKGKETEAADTKPGKTPVAEIDPKTRERINFLFIEAETQYLQGNYSEAINLFQQVVQLEPKNSASLYNIAKIYIETGDLDNGIAYSKQALDLDAENYWYYYQLAGAYADKMEFGKATEVQTRLVKKFPEEIDGRFDLAQYLIRLNKLPEAAKEYDEIEKRVGMNEEVLYRKHQIYLLLNDLDKAEAEVDKLIKGYPGDSRHYKSKYDILMMKGEKENALNLLKEIIKINPTDGFALLSLADYYKTQGDIKTSDEYLFRAMRSNSLELQNKLTIAGGMFQAANSDPATRERLNTCMKIIAEVHPNSPQTYGILGDVFRSEGKMDSARVYYRKAVDLQPTNEAAWEQLLILDNRVGDFKALAKDADKAIEFFPNQVVFLFYSGGAHSQLKEYEEAIWALEKVKKISTETSLIVDAATQLGEVYHKTGQFAKSDENFETALSKAPNNVLVLNNYAWFLSLRGEKLDKAEEMVLKALKAEPENGSYMDTYGWVLYKKGDYKKAEQWLAKALADSPNSAEVLEHYGDVLFKLGERDRAIENWKKAQMNGATDLVIENKLGQGE